MRGLGPILSSAREEDTQRYLATHPELLLTAFTARHWYFNACIPKFRFGTEFVSDFVLVSGQSGGYDVILVELEPPTASLFTKQGRYAARLNAALGQVNDWLVWIQENHAYFRSSLAKAIKESSDGHPASYAADQIDPDGTEGDFYGGGFVSSKIVIGRRSMLSEADNKRRSVLYAQTSKRIEIVPFDRLLDVERRLDDPSGAPRRSK